MNASADSHEDNGICGSDSDSTADDSSDYYQPISSVDNGGEDSDDSGADLSDRDPNSTFHPLPNDWVENGVSSLDRSDDDAEKEVEEATESERAIERAFREDEARRNAPLTAENTGRVMDAMRQISFGGGAPDWACQIPEDQWIDRLRRLRPPSSAPIDH
ncbi:hypothetical protein SASPL_138226 [Salvia splendens]|uniref:Uncharacterized protein n=1 Tax=Salvia splendens TaxID=180675 RepID=A0A8X8ZE45_SALSN|nr:uncharacterized protein LOC121764331 [Salvia splendens]KAG6401372.1 hypothetical protein SASPL_138226 [Salvia splendens]